MSTIGENVQFSPDAIASRAATRAEFSIPCRSHEHDMPRLIGKIVFMPWITS